MQIQAAAYQPYVSQTQAYYGASASRVSTQSSGGASAFSTDFTNISSMLANGAGGGFATYKLGNKMGADMKSIFSGGLKGVTGGLKNTAITGLKGAGLSALVSAGVSAVANGAGVASGKIDSSEAVGNVVKDTIGGALGGLTGVTAGGVASLAMGAIGVTGVMGTVVTVAVGTVGGVVGGQMAKKLTSGF